MTDFKLIGIKLNSKTENANGQSGKDCGSLWEYFEKNKIYDTIPNKISGELYAVYYDYDSDANAKFSYFIGAKVDANTMAPEGLTELEIPKQNYHKIVAKGPMPRCIAEAWQKIWITEIPRKYGFDLEVYDERSHNWQDAEVDILLSI